METGRDSESEKQRERDTPRGLPGSPGGFEQKGARDEKTNKKIKRWKERWKEKGEKMIQEETKRKHLGV